MSLDISLTSPAGEHTCLECNGTGIIKESKTYFETNITHNLTVMARECGIYQHIWRPEELGISKAGQLIEILESGLAILKSDPPRFWQLNPVNGYGSYPGFVSFVEEYLAACRENPNANINVCIKVTI